MILNPQEEFVVARQLNDPNDAGTYYVRAFIRNAKTDALLATLNLNHKGSQRFTKTWQVPSDPTGEGFYITITSLVYTDSGYTTLSTVYGSEQHEFLVQDRINPFTGGPVAPDISYPKIKKVVEEVVANIKFPTPKAPEKFNYTILLDATQSILEAVKQIKIPEPNFDELNAKLDNIVQNIASIDIPTADFSQTNELIVAQGKLLEEIKKTQQELKTASTADIESKIDADFEEVEDAIKNVQDKLEEIHNCVKEEPMQLIQPKPSQIIEEYLNLDNVD